MAINYLQKIIVLFLLQRTNTFKPLFDNNKII